MWFGVAMTLFLSKSFGYPSQSFPLAELVDVSCQDGGRFRRLPIADPARRRGGAGNRNSLSLESLADLQVSVPLIAGPPSNFTICRSPAVIWESIRSAGTSTNVADKSARKDSNRTFP
jgi:hypothetical protein